MTPFVKWSLLILLFPLAGCSLVHYKIYVRNVSGTPAALTLIYEPGWSNALDTIGVKYSDTIQEINRKTLRGLNKLVFPTRGEDHQITLSVPPGTTFYLSDLLEATQQVSGNMLVIQHGSRQDTIAFNYPYREIAGMKRKLDPAYNYFYRTIVYFDLREPGG